MQYFLSYAMDSENEKDIEYGSCNIVGIVGPCFFVASESRLTKIPKCLTEMDKLTISSDVYKKIWKIGDSLYVTMCGSKGIGEMLRKEIEGHLDYSLNDIAKHGYQFLKKIADDHKKSNFTEEELAFWKLKYENAASFFCGFVDQKPVVYRVNIKNDNDAPLNIRTLPDNPGFDFLGSNKKQAKRFLVESDFFIRLKEFEEDENACVDDVFVMFAKTYFARAIVSCAIVDSYSGGNIEVKCISASGECLSYTSNVAQVYLDSYGDLETLKERVVLLFVSTESKDGADAVIKLTPLFSKWGTLSCFHRLGVFQKSYVLRLVFACKDNIGALAGPQKDEFITQTGRKEPKYVDVGTVKKHFSSLRTGLEGCFGLPTIKFEGVVASVLFPGSDGSPIKKLLGGNGVAGWV